MYFTVRLRSNKDELTLTRYFKHYNPCLPIFEATNNPETFYKRSPFVFWCIVVTGARRYELDPTLLDTLAPSVGQLAVQNLSQMPSYFSCIVGLMILCAWPLPMKSMVDDPSPMYCGAALQLALQNEIHLLHRKTRNLNPSALRDLHCDAFIARVWGWLEFTCHW